MVKFIAECAQGFATDSKVESIHLCKLLARSAAAAKANAAKFQLVIADELATPNYMHYNTFQSLDIGSDGWSSVKRECDNLGIELQLDIFGRESLKIALDLGVRTLKVHPTDLVNKKFLGLINSVSNGQLRVILGTGGADRGEIEEAIGELCDAEEITLMHGFQAYPTRNEDCCLKRLSILRQIADNDLRIKLGFADHCDTGLLDSVALSAAAIASGAATIEKHLTLSGCLKLEDYESALNGDDFVLFISSLRHCAEACDERYIAADNNYLLPESESEYMNKIRRDVVTTTFVESGHLISLSDICLKRSGAPGVFKDLNDVIGKNTLRSIPENTPIGINDVA